ncbi:MAG: RidA family protein [Desulfosudaceae bacterium]
MKQINTDQAPAAVGPYAQAVRGGNWLFCSGQIGLVPGSCSLAGKDIQAQSRQMLTNLRYVLRAAGLELTAVVKTTVYLKDMNDFSVFNDIYADFFQGHTPARSAVQVAALPLDALVEIECIAMFPS